VSTDPWADAVPLEGRSVRLVPLTDQHIDDLVSTCSDPDVLRWVIPSVTADRQGFAQAIAAAQDEQARGLRIAWAQVRVADGRAIGSTSFLDVSRFHSRVEIGATYLSRDAWRTSINTESKLLLLGHAFDALGCERVALKTDLLNERSQNAIERIGGVREGVLRHHMRRPDGSWRDTVYFSILRDEWPAVRSRLTVRLTQG
jgi:RimJ/RimL family protein N-acetyltransferase